MNGNHELDKGLGFDLERTVRRNRGCQARNPPIHEPNGRLQHDIARLYNFIGLLYQLNDLFAALF
jgi:hypothetical protein